MSWQRYGTILVAVTMSLFCLMMSAPAWADYTTGLDDFQCDVEYIYYSDGAGRSVNEQFNHPELFKIVDGMPSVSFNPLTMNMPAEHVDVFNYRITADQESAPASRLHYLASEEAIRLGLEGQDGGFAWFPLVMGDTPSYNMLFIVRFSRFLQVNKSQYGFHFELWAGGCKITGLWFTGERPDGASYTNALIFNATLYGSDGTAHPVRNSEGLPVEDIIKNLVPSETSVLLYLEIFTYEDEHGPVPGGALRGRYQVNDGEFIDLFDGEILDLRQVTGYDGTYETDKKATVHFEEGDPVGSFSFPFINMYSSYFSSELPNWVRNDVDEHVGGACFISSFDDPEQTLPAP